MFTTLEEFFATWQIESQGTQKLLDVLTDASLGQRVTDADRTLGRLAWHIVATIPEMMERTGLEFTVRVEENEVPAKAKEIADAYRQVSEALVQALREQWTDATLKEEKNMYGQRWPNSVTLRVLINHEIHHRGQMTVLMRQAGLRVPGIYGPAREEWSQMGMEAPRV